MHIKNMYDSELQCFSSLQILNDSIEWMLNNVVDSGFMIDSIEFLLNFKVGKYMGMQWFIVCIENSWSWQVYNIRERLEWRWKWRVC